MIILYKDKHLIHTGEFNKFYKYENMSDLIKIIIPEDMKELDCTVQVEFDDKKYYSEFDYDDTNYGEGLISLTIPITSFFTSKAHDVKMWLLFKNDDEIVTKSDEISFTVYDDGSFIEPSVSDDDSWTEYEEENE